MLFQRKCPLLVLMIFVCSATLFSTCAHKSYSSPEGYDLENPQTMQLGKILMEISGITYNDSNATLIAVSDSKRHVFEMNYKSPKLKDFTGKVIPPDSDVEDIAKINDTLYVLSSVGLLREMPVGATDTASVKTYQLNLQGTNDFETLYYDPSVNSLVLVCKSCAFEKGKKTKSAFRFDLKTKQFDSTTFFNISTQEIKKMMKDDNANFDPSAAAIHPINKRLYILSSAGNLLVVTDTRGKVVEAFSLNPDRFPQAEGIAFAPDGTMFITNEGKYGVPTLLIYSYKPQGKKK